MKRRAFPRVLASVILLLSVFTTPKHVQAGTYDFTVNSSEDTSDGNLGDTICADSSGECTLRAAMEEAEALYPTHTVNIGFDLPYPHTIVIQGTLPPLYANVVNGNQYRVIIDGDNLHYGFWGSSASTTISGLQLQRFDSFAIYNAVEGTDFITDNIIIRNNGSGLVLTGSETNSGTTNVQRNYIGYDPISESDKGNDQNGISIVSTGVVNPGLIFIGGAKLTEGNIISGNSWNGIFIDSSSLNLSMAIRGNYIGTDDSGNGEIQNDGDGIQVDQSLGQLVIGGLEEVGNLISGNYMHGMVLQGVTTSSLVQGNTCGTNAGESAYLPNRLGDIVIYDSAYLTIGGASTNYGNVLMDGIYATSIGHPISRLEIKANWIGTSRTGLSRIDPYASIGIHLKDVTNQSVISSNKITNFTKGIVISNRDISSNVAILNNSIYGNHLLGIDLNNDGVTTNDPPPDADLGPNGLQNFPVISNVEVTSYGDAKQVMFDLTIGAAPNTTYRLQVFSSPFCGKSGYGEGKKIFFSHEITTDSNGLYEFNELNDWYPVNIIGPCLTATATEFDGVHYFGTSEFSLGVMAWDLEKLFLPLILK